MHKDEEDDQRSKKKQNTELNEVKPVKNISKNLQNFLCKRKPFFYTNCNIMYMST